MERFIINGKDFIEAVRKTADIALQYKDNKTLTNTCILTYDDRVDFVALCHEVFVIHTIPAKIEGAENQKCLINTKALKYIAERTLDNDQIEITIERSKVKFETESCGTLHMQNHKITFKSNNYDLTTKLSPELFTEYPDYRKILPNKYDATIVINKQSLIDAINRAVPKRVWENKWVGKFETICLKTLTENIVIEAPAYTGSRNNTYRTAMADAIVKSNKNVSFFVKDASLIRALNSIDSSNVIMYVSTDYVVIMPKNTEEKTVGMVETMAPLWRT
jgi:DNA polymerase III sliding clamp (beta) subunit (PCNA family)